MKAFETKASKVSKGKSIPGLAPAESKPSVTATRTSSSNKANKSLPKHEARVDKGITDAMKALAVEAVISAEIADSTESTTVVSNEKRIKAIKKKLREIDELSSRDPSTLSAEQQEKLSRKTVFEEELKSLDI